MLQQCSKSGVNAGFFELWDAEWLSQGKVAKGRKTWKDVPTVIVDEDEVRTLDVELEPVTDEVTLQRLRRAGFPGKLFKLCADESAKLDMDFAPEDAARED